jgi:perosamine synthetase
MSRLGFNYRLPDMNCALGLAQLDKLPSWVVRRREIAERYAEALDPVGGVMTVQEPDDRKSSWHLYPIRYTGADASDRRRRAFDALRANGFGVTVHYLPVYLHSYYRSLGYESGLCPVAERAYEGLLSLPMWPGLMDAELDRVVEIASNVANDDG